MQREKAEAVATERMPRIAPLLDPHVDQALRKQLTAAICAQSGLSDRTVDGMSRSFKAPDLRG